MGARSVGPRHIASQLIRCGTSVGANAEEAQEGQSKADFIAKMSISSKEARETRWWLRVAVTAAKRDPDGARVTEQRSKSRLSCCASLTLRHLSSLTPLPPSRIAKRGISEGTERPPVSSRSCSSHRRRE
ncbi:MAG: four helix bundle protein [Vicinamibacterales bacterium]